MEKIPGIVKVGSLEQRLKACVGTSELDVQRLGDKHAPLRTDEPWDKRNKRLRYEMYNRGLEIQLPPDLQEQFNDLQIEEIVIAAGGRPLLDIIIFEAGVQDHVSFHGMEHEVFCDAVMTRAVKLTKPGYIEKYGVQRYVDRLLKTNKLFDDQIKIEGWILNMEGYPSVVSSQPWIPGKKPTQVQMDNYMRQMGFLKATDEVWYRASDDTWVSGVTNENLVLDKTNTMFAIDIMLPQFTEEEVVHYQQLIQNQPQPEVGDYNASYNTSYDPQPNLLNRMLGRRSKPFHLKQTIY